MALLLQQYVTLLRPLKVSPISTSGPRCMRLCTQARLRQEGMPLLMNARRKTYDRGRGADNTQARLHPPYPSSPSPIDLSSAPPEPYFVHRTKSNNFPVYQRAARGGNLRQTLVRKVEGDIKALRDQLQQELNLDPKDVTINMLTKQVIVKVGRERSLPHGPGGADTDEISFTRAG